MSPIAVLARCLGLAIVLAASTWPAAALAGGKVTLCASDIQGGPGQPGLNLRDALAGGGTVTFACKPGATIAVTMTHAVGGQAVIDGQGSVALKATSAHAMFLVSGTLSLKGLTLSNPFSGFGLIKGPVGIGAGPGVIVVEDSQVRDSTSPFQVDIIRLEHCVFENNHGFSIVFARVAVINRSTFVGNDSVVVRSPPTVAPDRPSLAVVIGSTFSKNQMAIAWVGELHVSQSVFTDNDSKSRPGAAIRLRGSAAIDHSRFDRNHASAGGAIWVDGGSLALRRVVFHDNVALGDGGAVGLGELEGVSMITQYSTFEGNSAVRGGAVKLGTPGARIALQGGPNTFARNRASQGGAIYTEFGRVQLARAVFNDNIATAEGGAVFASRRGSPQAAEFANSLIVRNTAPAGAAVSGSAVVLINSTVADNKGVAISLQPLSHFSDPGARGEIDLRNSVVSNNSGGNCSKLPPGTLALHNGHSLQFPGNQCGAAVASADPLLDALYVPRIGSPAFAGGDNPVCVAAPISARDIYGAVRPQGKTCAVGAVEGEIDPRLFSLLWRMRDRLLGNYSSIASYLKK